MEFDASETIILIVFLGVVVGLIWEWTADWGDEFKDFWEKLDWKDDIDDDEDKRTKSRKK